MTIKGLLIGQNGTTKLNKRLPTTGTPVNTVAAQGTLTIAAQPTAGDTFTLGLTTYTFIANGEDPIGGQIEIGTDLAGTQANVVDVITGGGATRANFSATCAAAFAANALVITANHPGVAGNTIVTTETFTSASNLFDATTLGTTTAGVGTTAQVDVDAGEMLVDSDALYICFESGGTLWKKALLRTLDYVEEVPAG